MVERLVEIDARDFLDGTLTSRRVFQLTGPVLGFPPGTRGGSECLRRALAQAEPNRRNKRTKTNGVAS